MQPADAVIELLRQVQLTRLEYAPSIGVYEVRGALADVLTRQHKAPLQAENIGIVFGATQGVFLSLAAAQDTTTWGHVLPGWHTFGKILHLLKRDLVPLRLSGLSQFPWNRRHTGIFLNTPINPTGRSIPQNTLEELVDSPGLTKVVDMTYFGMLPSAHDQRERLERLMTLALRNLDHVCLVMSLSKLYRVPGLRLGFVVSSAERIARMASIMAGVTLNVPTDLQHLLVALWDRRDEQIQQVQRFLSDRDEWLAEACRARRLVFRPGFGTHFRTVELGDRAQTILQSLAKQDIFVAPAQDMGLPTAVRYNISADKSALTAFLDHLAEYDAHFDCSHGVDP